MGRTKLFQDVTRCMGEALEVESVSGGVAGRAGSSGDPGLARLKSRREVLGDALKGAASLGMLTPALARFPFAHRAQPRIAIVGAGLAGLACADRLQSKGVSPVVYEAQDRAGGRCRSLRGFFSGQVAERGGEFIDNLHKTMLGYANRFNLAREDYARVPGNESFFFDGAHYSERQIIEQLRALVPRMRADLRQSSGAPTFFQHTPADVALDNTDLASYLETRASDLPLIRKLLTVAYEIEYGLDASEQSCLNLLLFIHLDRRSKLRLWGVFSDERFHLTEGNDGIVQGLESDLARPIEYGRELVRLSRNASGEYELWFRGCAHPERADAVVVTIPFSVLRNLDLDASLGLSADKRRAIAELGYGTNAKTMIGFSGVPWLELGGSNGTAFTNLANVQNTWETNPSRRGANSILTDYAAGTRGLNLSPGNVQAQAHAFLTDLENVWPGVKARAAIVGGAYLASLSHWPSWPWALGSYTCYKPGQFTQIAGLEGQRAGNLHFAGEHANSFYAWQGFMEGACLSGIEAANTLLRDIKDGVL